MNIPGPHGIWGATCYFNPAGYSARLINYTIFRRFLDLPLITVELSFDGRFELGVDDAEILVQLDAGDLMWQKERLLNVAVSRLPPECRKVVLLDCDVIFGDRGWVKATDSALESRALVQPFSREHGMLPYRLPKRDQPAPEGSQWSFAYRANELGRPALGATGRAWAFRREIIEEHGLYDVRILGGADSLMALAAVGRPQVGIELQALNRHEASHYMDWAQAFNRTVKGAVGYVDGDVYAMWHGSLKDRRYTARHHAMGRFEFDPAADLRLSEDRCWRWASDKPALHRFVRDYFYSRNEDGAILRRGDGRVVMEVR